MTLVLVTKELLDTALRTAYACRQDTTEPGCFMYLDGDDFLVTLAVEAGLKVPGPLRPGTIPPPPPQHRFSNGFEHRVCAATYRTPGDRRLRCEADAKVVYTSPEKAESAAATISGREPMRAYLGTCGHYHVARRNK